MEQRKKPRQRDVRAWRHQRRPHGMKQRMQEEEMNCPRDLEKEEEESTSARTASREEQKTAWPRQQQPQKVAASMAAQPRAPARAEQQEWKEGAAQAEAAAPDDRGSRSRCLSRAPDPRASERR